MIKKQITSADQLVDGKKYWLQSEFSPTRYESTFWEADKHTAWFTTYMQHARVIGWTRHGVTFTNRQELFDLLAEMKVKIYTKPSVLNSIVLAETVQTKHGEIVVHDYNVLTYVGGEKWAVEQRKEHRDGITQR